MSVELIKAKAEHLQKLRGRLRPGSLELVAFQRRLRDSARAFTVVIDGYVEAVVGTTAWTRDDGTIWGGVWAAVTPEIARYKRDIALLAPRLVDAFSRLNGGMRLVAAVPVSDTATALLLRHLGFERGLAPLPIDGVLHDHYGRQASCRCDA